MEKQGKREKAWGFSSWDGIGWDLGLLKYVVPPERRDTLASCGVNCIGIALFVLARLAQGGRRKFPEGRCIPIGVQANFCLPELQWFFKSLSLLSQLFFPSSHLVSAFLKPSQFFSSYCIVFPREVDLGFSTKLPCLVTKHHRTTQAAAASETLMQPLNSGLPTGCEEISKRNFQWTMTGATTWESTTEEHRRNWRANEPWCRPSTASYRHTQHNTRNVDAAASRNVDAATP